MATTIVTKNSSTASAVPTAAQLVQGELAVNVADKRIYTENNAGAVVELGTNPSTLTVAGEITANGGIALGDNDKATFGASDDLQIYHNGSNSIITETGTGNLYLGGDNLLLTNGSLSAAYLEAITGGAVNIYHNGATKLATTATGIDVTGTATMDGLTTSGNILLDGSGNPTVINKTSGAGNNPLYRLQADTNYWDMLGVFSDADNTFRIRYNNVDAIKIANNGDISFYEDTGTTAKLFWDASAESLGIGTSSPSGKLSVSNDGAGGFEITPSYSGTRNLLLNYNRSSPSYTGLDFDATDYIFYGSGTERMRIDSAGNVGIGISSGLTYPLTVKSDANNSYVHFVNSTTGSAFSDGSQIGVPSGSIDLLINNRESGNVRLNTSNTERMRIDNDGNVGIGTSSPSQILHVSNASNPAFHITNTDGTNGSTLRMVMATNGAMLTTSNPQGGSDALRFGTGNEQERMRIDSAGNLLVGKTVADVGTAGTALRGSTSSIFTVSGSVDTQVAIFNKTSVDGAILDFRKDGTTVGSIGTAAGNLYIVSNDVGLNFAGGNDGIFPATANGAQRDAAIDLGQSSHRFKDLYLSGGVYLGGTGAANHLDDYEEGTWTPTLSFGGSSVGITYSNQFGRYTKVGRQVTVQVGMYLTSKGTSTGSAVISGLPFAVIAQAGGFSSYQGVLKGAGMTGLTNTTICEADESTTTLGLREGSATGVSDLTNANFNNTTYFMATVTYFT